MEVSTKQGLSLGTVSSASLLALTASDTAPIDAENDVERTSADLAFLFRGLPEPLVPIALHPLMNFESLEIPYSVGISVIPNSIGDGTSQGEITPQAGFGGQIGNYYIRVSAESGFVGGCISRWVSHAGALVRQIDPRTGRSWILFDLHIASWWNGGSACFAVYESRSRYCRNTCNYPTWNGIFDRVRQAIAAGVPSWLAWTIASTIATAALGVLVVIPGVPPPP